MVLRLKKAKVRTKLICSPTKTMRPMERAMEPLLIQAKVRRPLRFLISPLKIRAA